MKHLILVAVLSITHSLMADVPGFAITKGMKENTYNIIYQAKEKHDVRVTILNSRNSVVGKKIYRSTDGFRLPVNFNEMDFGKYVIKVSDGVNTYEGIIDHKTGSLLSAFHVTQLREQTYGKFLVSFVVPEPTTLAFRISDRYGNVIHQDYNRIEDQFATVVHIKNFQGPFEFEVTDSRGFRQRVVR